MKKLLLIIFMAFLSCGEEPIPTDDRTECQKALEHIRLCIGYRPYLPNCDDVKAEKILSTPCENIKELWR